MRKIKCPSQELLNRLLRYDPGTGKLFWKERTPETFVRKGTKRTLEHGCSNWNSKNYGNEAFTANSCGKRAGEIYGRNYLAHRIIWKMVTGEEPEYVDHINGDSLDNRLINLRSVSNQENMQNMKRPSSNSSGFIGVSWHSQLSKWRAYITKDRKQKSLGLFETAEKANEARLAASKEYGFHENHGR